MAISLGAIGVPTAARAEPPAGKGDAAAQALPPAPVRTWLVTPTRNGPWTIRVDNTGDHPVRIPADVRLLRLELVASDGRRAKRTVRCDLGELRPDAFPDRRALYLAPSQSWVETFDPRLICFGKDAELLAGSVLVRARFGWDPPPKRSKARPEAPFAADGVDDPAFFGPLRELGIPSVMLSYDEAPQAPTGLLDPPAPPQPPASPAPSAAPASPAPAPPVDAGAVVILRPAGAPVAAPAAPAAVEPPPPPIVDANAPRIELTQGAMSDARGAGQVTVTVTATNVGKWPLIAPFHARMLEFRVLAPDGRRTRCDAAAPTRAIARDLYRTMKPGASMTFPVRLLEVCPVGTFGRPGLYSAHATLRAREPGTEVGLEAYTGIIPAIAPTLVRVQSGPSPFYTVPPAAVATPVDPSAAISAE